MILISRAAQPISGQSSRSARATKVPGATAPMTSTSHHDMWLLTTSIPGRLRIGSPVMVIRTPKLSNNTRQ